MVDAATFLASYYPEFQAVYDSTPGLVNQALADAERRTAADIFGDHTDAAHAALAAHLLASNPSGREARLAPKLGQSDGSTCYSKTRADLEALVGTHWIVP